MPRRLRLLPGDLQRCQPRSEVWRRSRLIRSYVREDGGILDCVPAGEGVMSMTGWAAMAAVHEYITFA